MLRILFFICLWMYVSLENFSLACRRHRYLWRASNFNLYSAIEQWWLFSLWHRSNVYNGHIRGSLIFAHFGERFAVKSKTNLSTINIYFSTIFLNTSHLKKINKIKHFFVLNIYNIFPITLSVTVSNNTSHPHSFWKFYLAY